MRRGTLTLPGVLGALFLALPAMAAEVERTGRTETNKDCLVCHAGTGDEKAPKMDAGLFERTVHGKTGCVLCHRDVETPELRHEDAIIDLAPVDCGRCHPDEAQKFNGSPHDHAAKARGCVGCHGNHDVRSPKDPLARVHPINQLHTCGECHKTDRQAAGHVIEVPEELRVLVATANPDEVNRLQQEGKLVKAPCSGCHGPHDIFPSRDERSTMHRSRVIEVCGKCHEKQKAEFLTSLHAHPPADGGHGKVEPGKQPPVCSSCHDVHDRGPPKSSDFRLSLVKECGTCHADLMHTYQQSYHGKATRLGDATVAKCADCHGAHAILPKDNPNSMIYPGKKATTCGKCHPGAPPTYASFWPHGDDHDYEKYPLLFGVWLAMTTLLISVFTAFGIHTLLWMIRDAIEAAREKDHPKHKHTGKPFQRFPLYHRMVHLFVVISFLGLAGTGAPLKFSHTPWARVVFDTIGGVPAAGWWHRFFAVMTFGYFSAHLLHVIRTLLHHEKHKTLLSMLLGPDSMVPRLEDAKDVVANIKYFLGLGPKPTWDRWTYWEKFDYWAVFWGIAVIGGSGLILWFPTYFAWAFPGWVINLALVIHSDEALLATGFIFAVHFFNGHLRRAKFPMDPVIFTGTAPTDEYQDERGREWARLTPEEIAARTVEPPSPVFAQWVRVFGMSAWAIGLILLVLIIHGLVTH